MKKLQLMACISCIAIFLSSCASQYHPDLVGHYKPNTDVAKKDVQRQHEEIKALAKTEDQNQAIASSETTAPEMKPAAALPSSRDIAQVQLSSKQQKTLNKVAEKINSRMEKATTKSEQQIQQNNFSGHHQTKLSADNNTLLYVILSIIIPPLAVGLFDNGLTTRFWIDLILTLLFFIPGVIYALIVVLGG